MHPKGAFFAFPHPAMIGPTYLAGQVEAEIYPKKDQEKVCNFLWHSEGGIFVAQVTRSRSDAEDVWGGGYD